MPLVRLPDGRRPRARAQCPAHAAALAGCVALALAGCASPGPAHPPAPLKTAADAGLPDAGAATLVAPDWWRALGDARLNALIERALAEQPSLALARARVERASALAGVAASASAPHAGLDAEGMRQRYSAHGMMPPPYAGGTYNSATVQFTLGWQPDFFGQHRAEWAAAVGQQRAAQADAAAAAHTLAAQVAHGYIGLARLLAQRAVGQQALRQRDAMLGLTRQRVSAGLDTVLERTQAEAALPESRLAIATLDEQITLARRQLAVLAGQPPQALDGLTPSLAALRAPPLPAALGADLLGRRAELVAARWRVEAATQDVRVARTQFYPSVNLMAFAGLSALGLSNLLQAGSRQYGVAPALTLPLFDGGRLRGQLGARQAELDAAIAQYNATLLEVVRQAGDAIASSQALAGQQREQARTTQAAERTYDIAVQRYRAGLSGQLNVLNAESQVLAQRRQGVDLAARALDTRVSLYQALGGGWQADGELATGALPTPGPAASRAADAAAPGTAAPAR